jgi:hypothetical protein
MEIKGPWTLFFGNSSARTKFDRLSSWSENTDPIIRYFSGSATYLTTFLVPNHTLSKTRRIYLDLGRVEVMARVILNGRDLGILWKAPYSVDVTECLRSGPNLLQVKVVNLWPNRLIGDEQVAEDSVRNPDGTLKEMPGWVNAGRSSPAGRQTFTTWRLWKKDDKLMPSGLLGPVRLTASETVRIRP